MRTRVCITIDTEFSIGGAFGNAGREPVAEPLVWCNARGRSEGLGFMLDTFRQYGVQATFFVETVQRLYFRHDPMRPIAQKIRDEGHEVQLHTHPCWTLFEHEDWRERARQARRPDDFFGRSEADSVRLLEQGIATFRDWGVDKPKAFRSGNLQHDANLYKAMKAVGIPYSSNIAAGVFQSGDPQYKLYSGQHLLEGVVECPVLTFADWRFAGKTHLKALTIAGTSFRETRILLEKARAAGIPMVVILTHPFEYVRSRDVSFTHLRRQYVTQRRLVKLCQYLQRNSEHFDACGFAHALDANATTSARNELLDVPLWHSVPRMAEQVIYDKYSGWALGRAAS
jgi:peptidoglycan/xylan/chitin deacetylase (PgdA/CDA1 family)